MCPTPATAPILARLPTQETITIFSILPYLLLLSSSVLPSSPFSLLPSDGGNGPPKATSSNRASMHASPKAASLSCLTAAVPSASSFLHQAFLPQRILAIGCPPFPELLHTRITQRLRLERSDCVSLASPGPATALRATAQPVPMAPAGITPQHTAPTRPLLKPCHLVCPLP